MKNWFSRGLYQEDIKIIACLCMLIDHIGIIFFSDVNLFRIIGRVAFPIYCFLLTEGFAHTHDKRKYGLRLLIAAAVSEIPYDLASFGQIIPARCSVMVTLLLGFAALWLAEHVQPSCKGVLFMGLMALCVLAADRVRSDYGGRGVLMVLLFAATADLPRKNLWRFTLFVPLCFWMRGFSVKLWGLSVPVELFAVLSLPFIACYNGKKRSHSAAVSRIFYGFYPGHLLALYLLKLLLRS